MTARSLVALLLLSAGLSSARGGELAVSRFSADGLAGWEVKEFKGGTVYGLVRDGGRVVLRADSRGTASALVKRISFDPRAYRYLRWSWKVLHTIPGGDERKREGDDYAARVYVVFPGRFFWQMRAINYIWANRLPKGESIPNAFTSSAMMVAVESGAEHTRQWMAEERDLLADYRKLFGGDPGEAGAVAVMTDTDNTGSEAVAWYGDITLSTDRSVSRSLPDEIVATGQFSRGGTIVLRDGKNLVPGNK